MAKRWMIGLVGAFAVLALTGAGFSAFTASATVYGTASAATMGLEIVENATYSCYYFYNIPGAPGNVSFTGENVAQNEIFLSVSNLTPSVYCVAAIVLENTGSVPVNVSVSFLYAGANGMCAAYQSDCYGVFTLSGVGTDGQIYWYGSPYFGTPTDSSTNFTTLNPGASYYDLIGVDLPPGSTFAPAVGSFALVYTAVAGF